MKNLGSKQKEVPGFKSSYGHGAIKADYILERFTNAMIQEIKLGLIKLPNCKFHGRIYGHNVVFYDLWLQKNEYTKSLDVCSWVYRPKAGDPGFDSYKAPDFYSYEETKKKIKESKDWVELSNKHGISKLEIWQDYLAVEEILEVLRKVSEVTRPSGILTREEVDSLLDAI